MTDTSFSTTRDESDALALGNDMIEFLLICQTYG